MEILEQIPIFALLGGLVVAAGLLGWLARKPIAGAYLIAALVFISGLGIRVAGEERIPFPTWIGPIQYNRIPLVFAISGLLFVGMLAHAGRLRWYFSAQGFVLLLISLYAGLLRMNHEDVTAGLLSIGLALLMRVPLMTLIPNFLDTDEGAVHVIRSIVYMMAVWCGVIMVQAVLNRSVLFGTDEMRAGFRFTGLTGNPQAAAIFLAPTAGICLWYAFNGTGRRNRIIAGLVTAATIVMLAWTGSRTGALMFIFIACGVLYTRLGRTVLMAPVLAAATMGLWWFATAVLDIDLGLQRLTATDDTRSVAWTIMWETAKANPILGVGADDAGSSENSFLYGFASYGIGMLFLIGILFAVSAVQVLHLMRIQGQLSPLRKQLAHLAIAFNAMYFVGAVFEGYVIARISVMSVYWFIFAGITARLIADHRAAQALADPRNDYLGDEEWIEYADHPEPTK